MQMNYLDTEAELIKSSLPPSVKIPGGSNSLFRTYALLARAKGANTTLSDVHDAWSAWMTDINPSHPALIPFDELDFATQQEDAPFLDAIRKLANH
jgi:hypothetical protein